MPTFPRGFWTNKTSANTARLYQRIERTSVQTSPGTITWIQDPVDLRGIPAIGRGVQGAIRHTRPDMIGD